MEIATRNRVIIGAVDIIDLKDGHIRVAGWVQAREVVLHMNGATAKTTPTLLRDDVGRHHQIDPYVGFDMTYPLGTVSFREMRLFGIEVHGAKHQTAPVRMTLRLRHLRIVQAGLVVQFATTLLRILPTGLKWLATRNPVHRTRIKHQLRLSSGFVARALDPDLFSKPALNPSQNLPVTIVLPVYNALDVLKDALNRIVKYTDVPWRLVLIEDVSTDARVRPYLRDWKTAHDIAHPDHKNRITLLENIQNLGFIQSVNRGFEQALIWGDAVVLLNSDALVPLGWASRLMHPIATDKSIATVTPMSNDAEIFTTPIICRPNALVPGQGDAIDAVARHLNPAVDLASAPTGVGFCMGISAGYLRQLTRLDTSFGRGYGEEVDWCQRARRLGGRHLGVPNVFVEHRGGQSFGAEAKQQLVARNNRIITKRYPTYDLEVQGFIATDPMRSVRLALGLAATASHSANAGNRAVPVYLAHSWGGGAENYLQRRIARDHTDHGHSAVILRVGGPVSWQIELVTPQGTLAGTTPDLSYVHQMLAPLTNRHIIYSCGVGAQDPTALPRDLLALSDGGRHPIDILFHDFYPLSPSYTLLDSDGIYRGTPRPGLVHDRAHSLRTPDGTQMGLADWQSQWGALITAADRLVVFSDDSAAQVRMTYPAAAAKIEIVPHDLLDQIAALPQPAANTRRVVGVLGNIGFQKGAALLGDLAGTLHSQDAGLVVVGTVDPAHLPPASVIVHGQYQLTEIPQIVARYGITDWLIPSIWPETFSYTTHEALATGLPVHAFTIGAQGNAVAKALHGHGIEFSSTGKLVQNLQEHFLQYFTKPERDPS